MLDSDPDQSQPAYIVNELHFQYALVVVNTNIIQVCRMMI